MVSLGRDAARQAAQARGDAYDAARDHGLRPELIRKTMIGEEDFGLIASAEGAYSFDADGNQMHMRCNLGADRGGDHGTQPRRFPM
jgi:hypothetical protein